MYKPEISEQNGLYVVRDTTNLGYQDRAQGVGHAYWVTYWDINFRLVDIFMDKRSVFETLVGEYKTDFDYNRIVRAKNRHLKLLKDHLGIEKIIKKENKRKIIWNSRHYFNDKMRVSEFSETEKMFGDYKKAYMKYTDWSPEKEALAKEYNAMVEEYESRKQSLVAKIFDLQEERD